MPNLTIALNEEQFALLKSAADREYRTIEAYCLHLSMLKAKKRSKMLASHETKRRARAHVEEVTGDGRSEEA
jgi:hypothetical protein